MKNYNSWLKQLKKEHGIRKVSDLLALSVRADPFYKGAPVDIRDAEWFLEIWKKLGFDPTKRIHLRRIHYRLISLEEKIYYITGRSSSDKTPVKRHYQNTLDDWKYLGQASRCARELGLVCFSAIKDEKNPTPIIGEVRQKQEGIVEVITPDAFEIELPESLDLPGYHLQGFQGAQRYYMELWCEKSTINDVLLPIGKKYGISVITSQGFQSLSTAYDFIERVEEFGKPGIIFYISDFDPSGRSMPNAVSRHIQYMLEFYDKDLDIKLIPIVLTEEQVNKYCLPTVFVKDVKTGSSSHGKAVQDGKNDDWIKKHGNGTCELDALEAIYPGELKKIIKGHILNYYDETLDERVRSARKEIWRELEDLQSQADKTHQQAIEEVQDAYDALKAKFEDELADIQNQAESCNQGYKNELEELLQESSYEPPEAEEVEDIEAPFFDSYRDYMEQNEYFQEWKGDE